MFDVREEATVVHHSNEAGESSRQAPKEIMVMMCLICSIH